MLTLAGESLAGYRPSLSITAPANGTTLAVPSVTVSGTAADTGALASVTVNGSAVSVSPTGTWTSTVALTPGANTITATATDQAGLTSSAAITVNYVLPVPRASIIGLVSGSGGKVTLIIGCAGALVTRCELGLHANHEP